MLISLKFKRYACIATGLRQQTAKTCGATGDDGQELNLRLACQQIGILAASLEGTGLGGCYRSHGLVRRREAQINRRAAVDNFIKKLAESEGGLRILLKNFDFPQ